MINWAEVRAKFPVTSRSVYLNTAAAGPLAESTAKAGAEYYEQMMNDGDVHWDTWLARREEVRKQVAAFINAEPEEIGFTTNTSSGMNLIVDALEKHGEVISCDLEFPVTTIAWMHRRIPVHFVKAARGVVRPEDIRTVMNTRTGIISMSYVQFSNGFRYRLLQATGGWWVDTDVLCLSAHEPDAEIVLGWEALGSVGSAIMKLPAQHPLLSAAWDFWAANRHVALHAYTGPKLLTQLVHEHGIVDRVMPLEIVYPISWKDVLAPFDPCRCLEVRLRTERCPFLHLWNAPLSHTGIDRNIPPPQGSFLRDAINQHLGDTACDRSNDAFVSTILRALMTIKNHLDDHSKEHLKLSAELAHLKTQRDRLPMRLIYRARGLLRFLSTSANS